MDYRDIFQNVAAERDACFKTNFAVDYEWNQAYQVHTKNKEVFKDMNPTLLTVRKTKNLAWSSQKVIGLTKMFLFIFQEGVD